MRKFQIKDDDIEDKKSCNRFLKQKHKNVRKIQDGGKNLIVIIKQI